MNKKIYLLLLLMVLGICISIYAIYSYSLLNLNTDKITNNTKLIPTTQVENKQIKPQSILDLITSDKNLECTFSLTDNNIKTLGNTYISGNKIKGDFITTVNGNNIKNYILSDGNYFYNWNDISNNGIKIKITEANASTKSQQLEFFKKFNDKYPYNCKSWINPDIAFDPPSNVKFSNFSENSTTQNTNINMCSGCDFITDESAKKECKQQFNCK